MKIIDAGATYGHADASGTATRRALSVTEREALETMRDNIARAQRFVEGFDLRRPSMTTARTT